MKKRVSINSKVTIRCNGVTKSYYIVKSEELDTLTSKISSSSPLGQILLKSKVNDLIKVKTPSGITEYKVVSIGK